MWAARRYRYIWAIVSRLPRDSHYIAELADDDELADSLDHGDPEPPAPPSLAEFGPGIEQLAAIRDLLGVLVAIQTTAPGKRPRPPEPVLRPVTAAQRARKRAADAEHAAMAAQLWPDKTAG